MNLYKIIDSYFDFYAEIILKIRTLLKKRAKKRKELEEIIRHKDKIIQKLREENQKLFNILQKVMEENITLKKEKYNYTNNIKNEIEQ
ncbi:MAG: hypothetical protein QXD62_03970 [Candidatus Woesearchaeota archaeon]